MKKTQSVVRGRRQSLCMMLVAIFMSLSSGVRSENLNTDKTPAFLESEVHLLLGGSYVTDNYMSSYSQISDLNNSMGFAWGLGVSVKFNLSSLVGLGTELNYLRNSGKMDMAITTSDAEGLINVSNVFIKNSYRSLNVPVYVRFGFDVARNVKWNVDGGMYFDFGTSGSQKSTIYTARVNELGQLATVITPQKTDYYNDDKAFLNSYRSFDTGLHLATGLTFKRKISIAVRGQFGFRNVAQSEGIVKPNSHNIRLFATIGYVL
ncbi:MAG: PorT family protein [Bacteroides sp.]|nr:PorT family protein [Bacteroides sp.]